MLLRMYTRWGERHKFKVELIEETSGDEAGIKSATLLIKGHNAYGWAKTEVGRAPAGAHLALRFQRAAPHQLRLGLGLSGHRRQDRHQINESDCRIDTYRAQGAGGQHINTTEFGGAHHPYSDRDRRRLPGGAFAAPEPRHRVEHAARPALRAANWRRREAEASKINATKTEIGWGHQIRSYVLQPYQMVKDLRTGVVSGTPDEVLDGDIDAFMEAALAQRVHGGGPDKVDDVD